MTNLGRPNNILEATEALIAAIEATRCRLPDSDGCAAAERNLLAMCQNAIRRIYKQRNAIERRQQDRASAAKAKAARDADTRSFEEKYAAWVAGLDPDVRARLRAAKDDGLEEVARLKAQLFKAHPDHGGSSTAFREVFKRYEAARKAADCTRRPA